MWAWIKRWIGTGLGKAIAGIVFLGTLFAAVAAAFAIKARRAERETVTAKTDRAEAIATAGNAELGKSTAEAKLRILEAEPGLGTLPTSDDERRARLERLRSGSKRRGPPRRD